jgi:hypothetical protein
MRYTYKISDGKGRDKRSLGRFTVGVEMRINFKFKEIKRTLCRMESTG